MLNMIKLDWLGMKCYWLRIIILPIVICFYGLLSEAIIIPFVAFMMLSFSVNPFAVEEKGKLDNLYLTLPINRKTIVNTRFSLSLIMQLVGIVFGVLATVLMASILYGRKIIFYEHYFNADFPTILLLVCGSLLLYAVMNLATFPILFKIGYAKGKALGFYIPIAAATVLLFVVYYLWYLNEGFRVWIEAAVAWSYSNPLWMSGILLALAVFFLVISYTLSHFLYAKREF